MNLINDAFLFYLYPGRDLNPHKRCCLQDFLTYYGFRHYNTNKLCYIWGLDCVFTVSRKKSGLRYVPYSLYTLLTFYIFHLAQKKKLALARRCHLWCFHHKSEFTEFETIQIGVSDLTAQINKSCVSTIPPPGQYK